jgi:hypothetical protein
MPPSDPHENLRKYRERIRHLKGNHRDNIIGHLDRYVRDGINGNQLDELRITLGFMPRVNQAIMVILWLFWILSFMAAVTFLTLNLKWLGENGNSVGGWCSSGIKTAISANTAFIARQTYTISNVIRRIDFKNRCVFFAKSMKKF